MTWEWSHTQEAYQDAELNLRDMSIDVLIEIASEWHADDGEYCHSLNLDMYEARVEELKAEVESGVLTADLLADWIWGKAEEQRSCTNGGHAAYMCPFGCEPHQVSFDRVDVKVE